MSYPGYAPDGGGGKAAVPEGVQPVWDFQSHSEMTSGMTLELVGPAGPQAARAHAETDVVSAPVIVLAKKLGRMVLLVAVDLVRV